MNIKRVGGPISIFAVAITLLGVFSAHASHFRGGSAQWTVNSAGLLTVDTTTLWRSDFIESPFFNLYTGAGGTGTNLGALTPGIDQQVGSGTEACGLASPYIVKHATFTKSLSAQSAGVYYARWTNCCRVASINNVGQSSWDHEVAIHYTPGLATGGPTMLPATIDIITQGQPYSQNLNSIDPDHTPVGFQFIVGDVAPNWGPATGIPGLALDAIGTVSLSAASTATLATGRWVYKVRVTDGNGGTAERDVLVNVCASTGNNPPVLAAIGPKFVNITQTLSFGASGTDPDAGNTATIRARPLPNTAYSVPATFPQQSQMMPGTVSSTFTWTPQAGDEGTYNVFFEVFDDPLLPLIDSETVTITVSGNNNPPILDPIGDQSVANGGTLSFQITGSDPDLNTISCSAFFLPPSATFNTGTCTFSWSPSPGQYNSTFTGIVFRMTDNGVPPLYDEESINITVGAGNLAPQMTLTPPGAPTINWTVNTALSFDVTATDANTPLQNLNLTEQLGLPSGATFAPQPNVGTSPRVSTFSWTPTVVGTYAVKFRAEDNGTPILATEQLVTINVTPSVGTFVLQQWTFNGGGQTSVSPSGSAFRFTTSIGQESTIGTSSSFDYVVQAGFWSFLGSGLVPVILSGSKNLVQPANPDLSWTGNNPQYSIYRSTNCSNVFSTWLTSQSPTAWTDSAPPVSPLVCYNVLATAPGPIPPPDNDELADTATGVNTAAKN